MRKLSALLKQRTRQRAAGSSLACAATTRSGTCSDETHHRCNRLRRNLWLKLGAMLRPPGAAVFSSSSWARRCLATIVGVALLMNIFERKQEARNPFYRVVELTDDTEDPAAWGKNFPLQYDDYKRTVDQVRTRFGGSEALPVRRRRPIRAPWRPSQGIEEDPRLQVMWADTRLPKIFARSAGTLTCSTTRCSPNANK